LIHYLVRSASGGANYLLNVGPTAAGEILPAQAQRLREVGQWLATNGDAIYGTRAGKLAPSADVVSTSKGAVHYVHALNYVSDCVKLTGLSGNYQATLLRDGSPVKSTVKDDALVLTIPPEQRDPINTVVVLTPE
jgi:alpha-L-fucosidase